jgi:hypothetical protein
MMRPHGAGKPRGKLRGAAMAPRKRRHLSQLARTRREAYRFYAGLVAIWVLSLVLTAGKLAPPGIA